MTLIGMCKAVHETEADVTYYAFHLEDERGEEHVVVTTIALGFAVETVNRFGATVKCSHCFYDEENVFWVASKVELLLS